MDLEGDREVALFLLFVLCWGLGSRRWGWEAVWRRSRATVRFWVLLWKCIDIYKL